MFSHLPNMKCLTKPNILLPEERYQIDNGNYQFSGSESTREMEDWVLCQHLATIFLHQLVRFFFYKCSSLLCRLSRHKNMNVLTVVCLQW